MSRFTAPDGTIVDVIMLSLTGGSDDPGQHRDQSPGDGQQFRVRYPNGILKGYAKTVEGLAELVDIGSLMEVNGR